LADVTVGQWERWSNWPLMAASLLFLAAYAAPIINPELPPVVLEISRLMAWATWALFAADYVMRLALAWDRWRYALRHWLDLLIIALPLLRPLRLLRLVTLLRVVNSRATVGLRGRLSVYVAGGACLLGFCGALAVLDAERSNADANITTFSDAIWWAVTTMTTVGYGDRYPTTSVGRLAAVGLMVGGIAVLAVVTATLASWLVEQVKVSEEEQTEDLRAEISELRTRLDRMAEKTE
jgi:voltage-gated potassium channel